MQIWVESYFYNFILVGTCFLCIVCRVEICIQMSDNI